ncbi:MAG: sugar transferase [Kiritimatiellae bacterium]|nr:sugar transferase [Kiritimatiellia bacterium]
MKRLFDLAATVAAAPLWLPLFAFAAFLAAISGCGGVFFRQQRAGLGGRVFTMLKFRTMRPSPGSDMERTTRIGSFLRATSLDELPQLLHVLSGKMSLVGPRPLPAKYLPRYSAFQARRHEVRPGLTGWAQINGRNAISWEEKFALDVWYVDNASFLLDMKILAATVLKVLSRKGVNSSREETMEEFMPGDVRP